MGLLDLFRTKPEDEPQGRSSPWTLAQPAWYMGLGLRSSANETVTESTSLGLTAVYRAVQIISGTIAQLPLHTYRSTSDGQRVKVPSWIDDPGAPMGVTRFEWLQTLVAHLLLHGNAFGLKIYNGAGAIVGMQLIHPSLVGVEDDSTDLRPFGRKFTISVDGQSKHFTEQDITHFRSMNTDGLLGLSMIAACRNTIGTSIAADKAAGRMFSNGLLLGGVVSIPDEMDEDQAKEIQAGIQNRMAGTAHAGDIAVINRALEFKSWTMSAEDAQFIESRKFQVEEIARMTGVPKVLLAEDGASTWGSGIAELIRGFQRFTLTNWTTGIEQTLSRLLPNPRFAEFDYAGLLAPDHAQVVANLEVELRTGLLTLNEARRILNRPPLPGGDEIATSPPAPSTPDEETTP